MEFQDLILDIDEQNHDEFISKELSALHFFSDWHMNCLMVLPIFESLAEELSGKISFGKVDIEECESIARRHNVEKVPTIILFRKGSIIDRIDDCESEEVLREKLFCLV